VAIIKLLFMNVHHPKTFPNEDGIELLRPNSGLEINQKCFDDQVAITEFSIDY